MEGNDRESIKHTYHIEGHCRMTDVSTQGKKKRKSKRKKLKIEVYSLKREKDKKKRKTVEFTLKKQNMYVLLREKAAFTITHEKGGRNLCRKPLRNQSVEKALDP